MPTAIRARRTSMWSTGSSASHSRRRATTCSACSRTSRSTAIASAATAAPSFPRSTCGGAPSFNRTARKRQRRAAGKHGRLRGSVRLGGRRSSSVRPRLRAAHRHPACRRLPAGARAHLRRFSRARAVPVAGRQAVPARARPRLPRPRPLRVRPRLAELRRQGRARRRACRLTAASIEAAIFVGTSRGGLLTMALSAARPALLRGAVLNDIGPVIEGCGLARIRGYVGKLPAPADYGEAVDMLKKLMSAQFTALSEEEWRSWAEATWKEENGRLVTDYDPALARTLESIDLEAPLAPFWFLFEGLKRVPVLTLRGANSDLLSAETFRRHGSGASEN